MNPPNHPDQGEPLLVDELALLRAVIDAVPDPIFCKDREGRYLLTNQAHSRRLGVPHGSCLGKNVFELSGVDSALAKLYHDDDVNVLATGEPLINHEEPFVWPDGSRGWYLTSKYPLRDAQGKIAGLVGIARDISQRRKAERKLDGERRMLRTVIDAVADPIFFKDHEGRFLLVNAAYEELFKLGIDDVRGRNDLELAVMSECAQGYADDDQWVLTHGRPIINREEPFPRLDGTHGWFLTSKFPLRDGEGRISGLVGIARDITEMRRASEELARSRLHYQTLVEATDTGYCVIDDGGGIIEANAEFVRLTGRATLEEIRGRNVREWTALHDHERNAREMANCVSTGVTRHLEIDYVWPDGRIMPIEINARLIDDGGGRRIIALCRDISDRRAAQVERDRIERKLQESQKLESLGVLAGGIAHDFNNLLTGILGNASLAALDLPPASPVHISLEQIETAARRAADLCQQMLAYSGKGRFVVRSLDLNAIIAETTDLLRVSISKNATLTLDLAASLPAVQADATQVRQIVMNLVVNASEAIGERGGLIRVSTGVVRAERETFAQAHLAPELPGGDYVFLEVADNGSGMEPEVRAKIFDPFFTTKFTGRGLGLAAVLGIVRGHGGALQVDTQPGRGTTFRILLPAAEGAVEIEAKPSDGANVWRGSGTILIIDDEATVRVASSQMLRSLGFDVRVATDGVEGIESFRAAPRVFAAILLDLTMPRLGGESVFNAIRELNTTVPVVMMSGYNQGEVAARFGANGPAAFVQKPFDLSVLREKLRAVLG